MQHFVYAAWHDVQAPLRTMGLYSGLLRLPKSTSSSSTATPGVWGGSSQLLTYTKLGSDPAPASEVVDLGVVLEHVVAGMQPVLAASGANVVAEPLPHVLGSSLAPGAPLLCVRSGQRTGLRPRLCGDHFSRFQTAPQMGGRTLRDRPRDLPPRRGEAWRSDLGGICAE